MAKKQQKNVRKTLTENQTTIHGHSALNLSFFFCLLCVLISVRHTPRLAVPISFVVTPQQPQEQEPVDSHRSLKRFFYFPSKWVLLLATTDFCLLRAEQLGVMENPLIFLFSYARPCPDFGPKKLRKTLTAPLVFHYETKKLPISVVTEREVHTFRT